MQCFLLILHVLCKGKLLMTSTDFYYLTINALLCIKLVSNNKVGGKLAIWPNGKDVRADINMIRRGAVTKLSDKMSVFQPPT